MDFEDVKRNDQRIRLRTCTFWNIEKEKQLHRLHMVVKYYNIKSYFLFFLKHRTAFCVLSRGICSAG